MAVPPGACLPSEYCLLCALRERAPPVTAVHASTVTRRRLFDIGLIPCTTVTCTARSPAGDPAAYLIRGAVVALRRADTAGVGLDRVSG